VPTAGYHLTDSFRQRQRIRNANGNGNATPTEMYGGHLQIVIHLLDRNMRS
jgi:hypothetical protein